MNLTLNEWKKIAHDLSVAKAQYEKHMQDSKHSYKETSMYQIFKRQANETGRIIDQIMNTPI